MMRTLFISAFSAVLLISCNLKKSKHIVLGTPSGWIRTDTTDGEGTKEIKFKPRKEDTVYYSGENVIAVAHKNNNLDRYIDEVCEGVQKIAVFYREESRAKVSVNGYDARWILQRCAFKKNPGLVAEQKIYFIRDEGTIAMVIFTAQDHGIPHFQSKIDEMLASFKMEPNK